MSASVVGATSVREVPPAWPLGLHPTLLADVDVPTPFLIGDLRQLADRIARFGAALPGVETFYAVKCNSAPQVLATAAAAGTGFEIASLGELRMLEAVGVDPAGVLYSNTVKPAAHVAGAAAAGVWRFAVDSEGELHKIARNAPGSAVYVRVTVDDSTSVFPLSRKFGVGTDDAFDLLVRARALGLRPYGVTFHVGSQCTDPAAWRRAVASVGPLLERLRGVGIELGMLDLGGGFPADYGAGAPEIEAIGSVVAAALEQDLPYRPELVCAEPGRHLVAETAVMVASVLGREQRADGEWLYTDVGAYHGMIETQQGAGGWSYPLWSSRADHGTATQVPYTVTGPTCDSADTMFTRVLLPDTLAEGDRLYIASAGAYTLSYASHFNGFPPPQTVFTVS